MCGIIAAVAQRDVLPILLDGLKRLEYRGYDSAGVAVLNNHNINRLRKKGKVSELENDPKINDCIGSLGIAHTRWATHGKPSEKNAHPHIAFDRVAVVHNGIIENYKQLIKDENILATDLNSETDTEVIAHLIYKNINSGMDLLSAVKSAVQKLEGAYALCIFDKLNPEKIIAVKHGSPLVVGVGLKEYFLASDALALQKVCQDFIYLEDGDIAEVTRENLTIFDNADDVVTREVHTRQLQFDAADKGEYRHYMQKEIFEQPAALRATLLDKYSNGSVDIECFGKNAEEILTKTKQVQIVACGTSYHAGLVAKHWIESIAKIPCNVDIASEFRYRHRVMQPNTLLVAISQSGETADTLAAINIVKEQESKFISGILAVCNVPDSSIVRASNLLFLTQAGPEIGVATTKAFTAQLTGLLLLSLRLAETHNQSSEAIVKEILAELCSLPNVVESLLEQDHVIKDMANSFADKNHALFLGRGLNFPIAMEGALKLKEISYIHAEAYPAGELKHGPLALVDKDMPVIVLAPNDELLEKITSNISEVKARGGQLFVFTETNSLIEGVSTLKLPRVSSILSPLTFTIPLQLLSYHVAVLKGTDVDQPRNLAKSVTVE